MRKTKVIGFSIPPAIHQKLERIIKSRHKTKSEFFREMIDVYFQSSKSSPETNLAKILRSYWQARSDTNQEIIIVCLAIIHKNNQVLIGARKNKDKWVKNLTWVFPGGKIESLDFDQEIKREVKEETSLDIQVNNLISARIHPDSGFKPVQIIALYFDCQLTDNTQEAQPNDNLTKLKWVRPTEVFKYFTTSTCDEVTKFLTTLEQSSK